LCGTLAQVEPDLFLGEHALKPWEELKNDDIYWRRRAIHTDYNNVFLAEPRPTDSEITKRRERDLESERDSVQEESLILLVPCALGFVGSPFILLFGWRKSYSIRPTRKLSPNLNAKRRRTWFERYLLLVSLASLLSTLICCGTLIEGIYIMKEPDAFLLEYVVDVHQNNNRYWHMIGVNSTGKHQLFPKPPEDELTRRRAVSLEVFRDEQRKEGKLIAILSGAGMLLSLVVCIVHFRLVRKLGRLALAEPTAPKEPLILE
jgi:hypothetical protein